MPRVIRRGLTIGGFVLVLLAAFAAPSAGATAPEGPRLAYLRFSLRPAGLEIRTSGPDGKTTEVIAGGGKQVRPLPFPFSPISWSPDGSQVAFGALTALGGHVIGPGEQAIFLAPADGGKPRAVPGTVGGQFPVFAPNGGSIAYARVRGRNSSFTTSNGKHGRTFARTSIWLTSLDGSASRQLTPWQTQVYSSPSSFSPDGSSLAITQSFTKSRTIRAVALRVDGGGSNVIAKEAGGPTYSPDGTKIALVRRRFFSYHHNSTGGKGYAGVGTTTDLYVMNANGSGLKPLTHTAAVDVSPAWDSSGERLAYVRLSTAKNEGALLGLNDAVMEINADGSCNEKVLSTPGDALLSPVWQPGPGREAGPITC
jgi:Tol biopolymer transport system component